MNNNQLTHYGVKGMKWGVRKAVSKGVGKAYSGVKKHIQYKMDVSKAARGLKGSVYGRGSKKAVSRGLELQRMSKERGEKFAEDVYNKKLDRDSKILYAGIGAYIIANKLAQKHIRRWVLSRGKSV